MPSRSTKDTADAGGDKPRAPRKRAALSVSSSKPTAAKVVRKKAARPPLPTEATLTSPDQLPMIGWTEVVSLPDWKIGALVAKTDTGARTSALHVDEINVLSDEQVEFKVVLARRPRRRTIKVVAPITKWARVRSSTGEYRLRCFVRTRVRLGDIEKEIEVSLVSREDMTFRMLLGRKAIEHTFLVDVSRRFIHGRPKRRKKLKKKAGAMAKSSATKALPAPEHVPLLPAPPKKAAAKPKRPRKRNSDSSTPPASE